MCASIECNLISQLFWRGLQVEYMYVKVMLIKISLCGLFLQSNDSYIIGESRKLAKKNLQKRKVE